MKLLIVVRKLGVNDINLNVFGSEWKQGWTCPGHSLCISHAAFTFLLLHALEESPLWTVTQEPWPAASVYVCQMGDIDKGFWWRSEERGGGVYSPLFSCFATIVLCLCLSKATAPEWFPLDLTHHHWPERITFCYWLFRLRAVIHSSCCWLLDVSPNFVDSPNPVYMPVNKKKKLLFR